MKVKDLMQKLSKLNGELEILCYTEDESLIADGEAVKALDIVDISETKLEVTRNDARKVQLKFTGTNIDRSYALIEITADL